MQDTLFVLCRRDVEGRSLIWPWRAMGGGLQSDVALSSLRRLLAPLGPLEEPAAGRPIEGSAGRENVWRWTRPYCVETAVGAALNLRSARAALPGFAAMRLLAGREEKA